MKQNFIIQCPQCGDFVEIGEINCAIFRHAILKINFTQINPHASKKECEQLISNNQIFGCGKPFKIIFDDIDSTYKTICCDYI
jgi:hypothetical protein